MMTLGPIARLALLGGSACCAALTAFIAVRSSRYTPGGAAIAIGTLLAATAVLGYAAFRFRVPIRFRIVRELAMLVVGLLVVEFMIAVVAPAQSQPASGAHASGATPRAAIRHANEVAGLERSAGARTGGTARAVAGVAAHRRCAPAAAGRAISPGERQSDPHRRVQRRRRVCVLRQRRVRLQQPAWDPGFPQRRCRARR